MIEVDGKIHDFPDQAEHDERRNAYIRGLGLKIVRIPASDLMREPDVVAQALVELCAATAGPSTTQLR